MTNGATRGPLRIVPSACVTHGLHTKRSSALKGDRAPEIAWGCTDATQTIPSPPKRCRSRGTDKRRIRISNSAKMNCKSGSSSSIKDCNAQEPSVFVYPRGQNRSGGGLLRPPVFVAIEFVCRRTVRLAR